MLPRWHIFWGAIFTILIWIFSPGISYIYLAILFLSSIFIDLDHYIASVLKTKKFSLFHSFDYHKKALENIKKEKEKGIKRKGDFHLFHTVEFHALIAVIGFFWTPFFFIFIGMIFHSLLDLVSMLYKEHLHVREYFFFNWLRKKIF